MDSADNQEFDYEEVESILADADCDASAAQIQAIMCGMLSAGMSATNQQWFFTIADMVNEGRHFSAEVKTMMQSLFEWSALTINQHDILTPMLLPDDSYPAIDQLEALTDWCQGFLLGFGLQVGEQSIDNEEIKESLTDLAEISNIELDADENDETQEALVTLTEHIKVATQLIYWEMVVKKQTQIVDQNTTLH
ncbi:UPF0149 family protein [Aliikangiella sp. IMCC44359]|uniref:UPF0149 family protein n=1 Tax=Aliikangiella sp. IMCC44359 TaxID=3459125 RepID=UPI00403B1AA0